MGKGEVTQADVHVRPNPARMVILHLSDPSEDETKFVSVSITSTRVSVDIILYLDKVCIHVGQTCTLTEYPCT